LHNNQSGTVDNREIKRERDKKDLEHFCEGTMLQTFLKRNGSSL
jgi:hypothetical protein